MRVCSGPAYLSYRRYVCPPQDTPVEVLDEDSCSSSLQAMASAPLLGRTVCANCNEDIVDKYLLKVKQIPSPPCERFDFPQSCHDN